jgi:hypothetical protein
VRAHAGHRQPFGRSRAGFEVSAGAPFGIGHHGLPADLVKRDVLGRMARPCGERQRRKNPIRVARRPLQHLHAAH